MRELFSFLDGRVDLRTIRKVVCQSRIDVGEFQVIGACYLVSALTLPLVPNGDVLNGNAPPCNAELATENVGARFDALVKRLFGHMGSGRVKKFAYLHTDRRRDGCKGLSLRPLWHHLQALQEILAQRALRHEIVSRPAWVEAFRVCDPFVKGASLAAASEPVEDAELGFLLI